MSVLKHPINSTDHFRGNVKADISLVEYGDFECPHCKLAHPLVNRLLKERGNELHFVFRNFPLKKIHPHAYMSAAAAEAAGKQHKFWEMHHLIFENQDRLSSNLLYLLAKDLNIDLKQFSKDSRSEEVSRKIETDFESGIRSGVNRTPTFFLNGFPILTYAETYDSLLNAVLAESRRLHHGDSAINLLL